MKRFIASYKIMMKNKKMKLTPHHLYTMLIQEFGRRNWWPIDKNYHKKHGTDQRFEIITGAILTQNTAWSNVEKALTNLKTKNMLDTEKISKIDIKKLQNMIKPSGFFNQKAERLKNLATYLQNNYHSDLDSFFDRTPENIREELLSLNGIGPETADSIILYAGNLPVFVVDAYTKRICKRIPLETNISYNEIQNYFEETLKKKYSEKELTHIYNELHALIVTLAKKHCKKKPECHGCPLKECCMFQKNLSK